MPSRPAPVRSNRRGEAHLARGVAPRRLRTRSLLGVLGVVLLLPVAAVLLSVRFQLRGPLRWVRRFNKRAFNRMTLARAGRRGSPFVLIEHVGRRSGRRYRTPVIAFGSGETLFIALTYGEGTDWCRNLRAAGQATVLRDGREYTAIAPEVVGRSAALPSFPPPARLGCRLLGIREFLEVRLRPDGVESGGVELEH